MSNGVGWNFQVFRFRQTKSLLAPYLEWAKEKKKPRSIENLSPEDLDEVLRDFYTELKKKDGNDYEPESLRVMQASLDRYLRNKGYAVSIIRGREFAKSNKILKGKAITLRHEGKGTRPNATDALTWEEDEMLWKEGRLGLHTPEVLLNTTWYLVTQHFGLRGRQENYDLRVEHFKFAKDESGRKYVTFADSNPTKTRLQRRMVIPRMVATGGERCPVSIFEEFISRRPSEFKEISTVPCNQLQVKIQHLVQSTKDGSRKDWQDHAIHCRRNIGWRKQQTTGRPYAP